MRKTLTLLVLLAFSLSFSLPLRAQDERLQIVASFSILGEVVSQVAGEVADVSVIVPADADPHSFQPSPREVTSLAEADVVFVNGMNFEEGLMEVIENAGDTMNIQVVSWCIEVIPFGAASHEHGEGEEHSHAEGEEHSHGEGEEHGDEMAEMSEIAELCAQHIAEMKAIHEEGHDHAEEEGHDHGHGVKTLGRLYEIACAGHEHGEEHAEGEEHSHEEGSCDPHVWQEPHNVMYWTMFIRDTLVALDPANAETYTANANAYIAVLDELAHDTLKPMVETLPEEKRVLVTNHEAFGYMAAAYGFEIVATVIPGGGTGVAPTAGELASLIDLIKEEGVTAIFSENTVSADIAEQIANETGAQVYLLYSDALSEAGGEAATYVDLITYNVRTIVEALSS